jgi:phage baseplate assembly protein V
MPGGSVDNVETPCVSRAGYVTAYDPKRHMARVRFPDKDNLVSAWIPVIVPNTKKNKDEFHLDIDEHVACVMLGNGLEKGFVLGSFWDDKNRPPWGVQDARCTEFEDGTIVEYNRKKHKLLIDCSASNGKIIIRAPRGIHIEADICLHGLLVADTIGVHGLLAANVTSAFKRFGPPPDDPPIDIPSVENDEER